MTLNVIDIVLYTDTQKKIFAGRGIVVMLLLLSSSSLLLNNRICMTHIY